MQIKLARREDVHGRENKHLFGQDRCVVPHESVIPVRIMNVHDEPIRIWKGTVMGLLEPVTEVRNLDNVPAEDEECTCPCAGARSDDHAHQPWQEQNSFAHWI